MVIGTYFICGYQCFLVVILLIVIGGYSINGHQQLFYWWLLVAILLMAIGGYCINGYLLINLLMAIGGYSINGYS